MSKASRILNIIKSLIMLSIGLIILFLPSDSSYFIACLIIGIIITANGIKKLIFYFASARHMIGGGRTLVNSLVYIDLGLISFIVLYVDYSLAILYLLGMFVMLGAIDIARAFEMIKNGLKKWVFKFIKGLLTIGAGTFCVIFSKDTDLMLLVFGVSWIVFSVEGFVVAFTRSAVEYIPEV